MTINPQKYQTDILDFKFPIFYEVYLNYNDSLGDILSFTTTSKDDATSFAVHNYEYLACIIQVEVVKLETELVLSLEIPL